MVPWCTAMEQALYGRAGFYKSGAGPAAHFRTSAQASPLFAQALVRLVVEVDELLDRPESLAIIDVGAADGSLLTSMLTELPPSLRSRANLVGVELRDRPEQLSTAIDWLTRVPQDFVGVLLANEWLDNVPVDVAERTHQGVHLVLVDPANGQEQLGDRVSSEQADWLDQWWPLTKAQAGDRAEVGLTRDIAWHDAFERMQRGLAVTMDYSHHRDQRVSGGFASGTLAGYREGRWVTPVPDGSCDITAHVALDSCADATQSLGVRATLLTSQRDALRSLGVSGERPPIDLATTDPVSYVQALATAAQAGELLDRSGLGGFGWLVQGRGVGLPPSLSSLTGDAGMQRTVQ